MKREEALIVRKMRFMSDKNLEWIFLDPIAFKLIKPKYRVHAGRIMEERARKLKKEML